MTEPREITERYRLEKILKSGRSGNVLKATDVSSGRAVVVKMITLSPHAADGEDSELARFERLAAALRDQPDPCFPAVLDSGVTTDGSAFLVLENLEGRGFESLAGGRGQRVLNLLGQVLDGLEALALRGLFHGSLSPDNLLVIRPQADRVKTFGLGTAYFRAPEAAAADSQNARYRAPEELALPPLPPLPDDARWRSDLYSLALTACRVLGMEISAADTPAPKVTIPTVLGFELKEPDVLRQMLEGALRRNPQDRPTLAQARNSLRRAQGLPPVPEAKLAPPAPVVPPPAPAKPEPPRPVIEETRPAFFPSEPAQAPSASEGLAAPEDFASLGSAGSLGALDLDTLPPLSDDDAAALGSNVYPIDLEALEGSGPPPVSARVAPAPVAPATPPAAPLAPSATAPTPPRPRPVAVPPLSPTSPMPGAAPASDESAGALLSFDDDLLGDLPPAPPPGAAGRGAATGARGAAPRTGPIPIAAAGAAGGPSAVASSSGSAGRGGGAAGLARFLKPIPLAAAGGGLVVVLLGGWWLFGRNSPPPAPTGVAAASALPAVPVPPPPPPAGVRLATAKNYLALGQEHEAMAVLRTLTPADQQALTPVDAGTLKTLQATLSQNAPARIANDLGTGWKSKDPALLAGAVVDAAQLPPTALLPSAQSDLAKARPVAELYDRAVAADQQGQSTEVLNRFGEIAHLLQSGRDSSVRDSSSLRERAAGKLETEAQALLRDARYDEAIAHLEPLSRTWPDRPGLKARLADVRAEEKAERSVQAAIDDALASEKLKKPDDGLAALHRVKPTAHLEASYNEVKQRLDTLLAQYDQQPPTVELRDGVLLDYDRGMIINVSFRIRDDYKVSSVKIYCRTAGGRMAEINYTHDRFTYSITIPPVLHQNETVELYVVATDPSGHETFLGTRDKPLQIKRRKGFRET
jgi:serine/threonine protein kinase